MSYEKKTQEATVCVEICEAVKVHLYNMNLWESNASLGENVLYPTFNSYVLWISDNSLYNKHSRVAK